MLLYFYQNPFSYVGFTIFPEQDGRIRILLTLLWQPLLGLDTQVRKQPQERVLRVVPAAEDRAYTNPRTCLWVTTLLWRRFLRSYGTSGSKDCIMVKSGIAGTEERHSIWSGLTGNSSLLF